MSRQSIQTVLAQTNMIRHLMNEEYKTDNEIMKDLRLTQHTFYDYKKRIQQEDQKIWDLVHQDSSKFRGVQLLADLDRCRMKALAMSEDKSLSGRDRLEALKTSCEASANIFKLLNEGLSFQVSIPNDKLKTIRLETVEEDKPKDDKDLPNEQQEPVAEHNNTAKNIIPSGNEPWGTSLQRPNRSAKPIKHKIEQITAKKVKSKIVKVSVF